LTNLLDNAAHYGDGKPIDVDLRCGNESICIRTGGSGLGLAIASQLAIKYGWTIELMPRDSGGTVARFDVPATVNTRVG